MGSQIDCFFPHRTEWRPEELNELLNQHFLSIQTDVQHVATQLNLAQGNPGWFLVPDETDPCLWGEGYGGFSILAGPEVAMFSSHARFSALYDDERWPYMAPLRRVICSTAKFIGSGDLIALGAGPETDVALDLVATGGSFTEVCDCLRDHSGPPATTWDELAIGDLFWYLGEHKAA